jgi:hypothetical protein
MEKGAGFDLSPGSRWSVETAEDHVVLTELATGSKRDLPLKDMVALDATVSDRGDVVVLGKDRGGEEHLGRLQPDGGFEDVPVLYACKRPELSSDGSRLVWMDANSVLEAGPAGPRTVVDLGYGRAEDCQFTADGRLVVRTGLKASWAVDCSSATRGLAHDFSLPLFRVLDPSGTMHEALDLATSKALSSDSETAVAKCFRADVRNANQEQCRALSERFGYRPAQQVGRIFEDGSILVWVGGADAPQRWDDGQPPNPYVDPTEPSGYYWVDTGGSDPRLAFSAEDVEKLGNKPLSPLDGSSNIHVTPNPGKDHTAVLFERGLPRLCVSDERGQLHAIPGTPDVEEGRTLNLQWSPDGRYLAVQMKSDRGPVVRLYDTQNEAVSATSHKGILQEWKDDVVRVAVGDEIKEIVPGVLDATEMRAEVLGDDAQPASEIRVGVGEVRIGGISLPVRR